MSVNISVLHNITTLSQAARVANNAVDGILFQIIIIWFFFMVFGALQLRDDTKNSLAIAGFIFAFLSLLLRFAQLLPSIYWMGFLILGGIGAFFSMAMKR